jgi:hypothetical protein
LYKRFFPVLNFRSLQGDYHQVIIF